MINVMTTFWRFLNEHTIEIPIIQRDYAQGRLGKEELRKTFLKDLKQALDSCKPLKLDFVYGAVESGKLNPLDGQQRLTTLWLLHWYLAYMAGAMNKDVKRVLAKFTYETRISSREFCRCLADFDKLPPPGADVVGHIQNQTWFRSAWKDDPTIQSMLRMLGGTAYNDNDGIEGVFHSCYDGECIECRLDQCPYSKAITYGEYWQRLIGTDCPIIFYSLDIHGINRTDDLYIKMNARGKPLTSFENFKADLAGYIEKSKNRSPEWGAFYDFRDGLPISIDTKWMQLFWANKSPVNTVDEAYFAFVNRFFFVKVCLDKTDDINWLVPSDKENSNGSYKYLNDSRDGSDFDRKIAYTSLEPYKFHYGEIPLSVLQDLKKTLDAFCDFMNSCKDNIKSPNELIPQCEWDRGNREFKFVPEYIADVKPLKDNSGNEIREITVLNQPQRVVFFAICKFFTEVPTQIDMCESRKRLKRWLRVVWNLVSVQDLDGRQYIRTFSAMRSAMSFISNIDSQDVYGCLANMNVAVKEHPTTFDQQFEEEVNKARKILEPVTTDEGDWEQKIIDAESAGFFRGAIRFLFTDKDGNVKWDEFDTKYLSAKKYFVQKGVSQAFRKNALLLRAFLARLGESTLTEKFWFGNGADFWRNQVLLNADFNSVVSELLQSEITHDNAIPNNTPAWIADDTLLSDAIRKDKKDKDTNGQWHVITDWFRCGSDDKTLTRYAHRIKGNVNDPWQIIPLEDQRAKLLDGMESDQRRGKCYFIGWKSDINFKYNYHWFQWHGIPDENKGEYDIYLLKDDWVHENDPYMRRDEDTKEKGDKRIYYCFEVEGTETKDSFKDKLNDLIKCAGKQSPVLSRPPSSPTEFINNNH